ncbi:MAG TPA: hypothetical protein PLI09_12235 [Candidatus Hydrogenedentes bacterium]|nr:hypothetical protein [Candidatus Hydrogenedentota bacterium]
MKRRDFLKATMAGGSAGWIMPGQECLAKDNSDGMLHDYNAPAILKSYTSEDHRRRLENIRFCERANRSCMRKHLITSYLPAQATYNLGEYPSKERWAPNDYDEQELDRLKDHGIQIIQVFDDWNDSLRLFGGDKLSAVNPEGFRRFVEMVHRRRMKIILYVSCGFLQRTDPDFRQEWSREGDFLVLGYWNMARCSPSSPGWRAYFLPKLLNVMEEYGADGIYNDCGYLANKHHGRKAPTNDEVDAFPEADDYDGAFTDLLALIYAEVKRRGGIYKLHVNAAEQPMTHGLRVYDYLWVGEGVGNLDAMRETVKDYPPYVVPCPDMTFAKTNDPNEPFLHAIPYMQFPVLQAGRPFTGARAMIPGIAYNQDPKDFWMRICREAWEHYNAHPEGPHAYGAWDAIPGRAETRPTHRQWLKQYLPLSEEGTWAWLDIKDSDLFEAPLPSNVVASFFANRQIHLVLANYSQTPVTITTNSPGVSVSTPDNPPTKQWTINARTLEIVKL